MSTNTSDIKPVITPFIKHIDGIEGITEVVLWDYSFRDGVFVASMYKSFLCMTDDYSLYTPIKFEKL